MWVVTASITTSSSGRSTSSSISSNTNKEISMNTTKNAELVLCLEFSTATRNRNRFFLSCSANESIAVRYVDTTESGKYQNKDFLVPNSFARNPIIVTVEYHHIKMSVSKMHEWDTYEYLYVVVGSSILVKWSNHTISFPDVDFKSALHRGQRVLLSVHDVIQSAWKTCLHGSETSLSPFSYSHKQIEHVGSSSIFFVAPDFSSTTDP